MTSPESKADTSLDSSEDAVVAATSLLEGLAERLGGKASVTAVFGTPIVCDGVTVIPVARVGFGFGGGAGREIGTSKRGEGGGGGGGAEARPLGFIEVREGAAVFKPIRDPWVDVVVPLAALVLGTAGPRIARAVVRHQRRSRRIPG